MKPDSCHLTFQNVTYNVSTTRMARMLSGNHSEALHRGILDSVFSSKDRDKELENLWLAIWPNTTGLGLQEGDIPKPLNEEQLDLQLDAFDRIRNASDSPKDFRIAVNAKYDNMRNGMVTVDVRFIIGNERLSHIQISARDYELPVPLAMDRFNKDYIDTSNVTCDTTSNNQVFGTLEE